MPMPPRFLFLEVNKACNLRCGHCDFWQRDDLDKPNYIDRKRKRQIVEEFAALSPHGSIVICGGEPMLDLEEYFAICKDGREFGLNLLSVVNGTRIRDLAMAEKMIRQGPHKISISLNSPDAAEHDRTRGVQGAFNKATNAIRMLLAARKSVGDMSTGIYVMGLVYGANSHRIRAFHDFVLGDLGADKLKLNFIQPTFGQSGEVDPFFATESDINGEQLVSDIADATRRHGVETNPRWLAQVKMYFQSLAGIGDLDRGWASQGRTSEHICNTYDRNIMVNHYGMARLCFSDSFRGEVLRTPGDLARFWNSAEDIRREMRQCNRFCGISHSVRKESSTLGGVRSAESFSMNDRKMN